MVKPRVLKATTRAPTWLDSFLVGCFLGGWLMVGWICFFFVSVFCWCLWVHIEVRFFCLVWYAYPLWNVVTSCLWLKVWREILLEMPKHKMWMILLMVQKSCTTWKIKENFVNNRISTTNLNWWVYRISETINTYYSLLMLRVQKKTWIYFFGWSFYEFHG